MGVLTRSSWYCLYWVSVLQGKFGDAEPICRRAMEITETTLGKGHPNISIILYNLATLLEAQVSSRMCGCTLGTLQ